MSCNKSAAVSINKSSKSQLECKKGMINMQNVILLGGYTIRWDNPCHHLAYKRLQYLSLHINAKCSLSNVFTADWEQYFDFNVTKSDKCFVEVAQRVLTAKHNVIYVDCMGCGGEGAPTTSNNPSGWHMQCWRKCLDQHPKASEGYTHHLANELAPRINKLLPNLSIIEFRELYSALEDQFWIRLFDLKTRGKYLRQRVNDKYQIYTGICGDFSLERMTKNSKYEKYVLKMLRERHLWYDKAMVYSCITVKSFINYSMKQDQLECKHNDETQSMVSNSNNQATKPNFDKEKK